ncbi:tetratricopeptide repeat-containing sulfotransferase family protein [Lacimicrobium alkaliphilum]|uniref:tetratricopeptide repeat-containing sulfotransferase family protein n=1 Tax=Lacimicrobium alkaliphilum TaxID=1526571 RepID=UPI001E54AFBE|nr:tetratricopeptide repeat-containing sulfotransferase family protein [Lacimicrobium alkaliphilum]
MSKPTGEMLRQIQQLIQQASFEQAEEQARELLAQQLPPAVMQELYYLLAVSQRYRGAPDEAQQTLKRLLQLNPEHARALQEQGYLAQARGDNFAAAQAFYRATRCNPALLSSWKALLALYQQAGQKQAMELAQQHISALEQLPPPLLGASDLMYDGKLMQAEQLCRQFLLQHKHHIEAMCLLAEIGVRLKIYDDAEFLLESCVELAPEHISARTQYLTLLLRTGKYAKAEQQARWLLERQPDNSAHKISLAAALVGLGENEQGIALYQSVLDKLSQPADVYLQLGHAQKAIGEFDAAVTSYQKAYQHRQDFGDAYWSLANTKTYRFSEQEVHNMQARAGDEQTPVDDKIHFYFALGKAFEDQKDYQNAFEYYASGNQLKQQQSGYEPDKTTQMVDAQIKHCTAELFEKRGQLGATNPDPIFILGLPRAGSTLLEQILASHSKVDGTMELHNILGLAMRLRGRNASQAPAYPANLWEIKDEYFARFGEQFIDNTRSYRGNAPFFIDKMPNNFLHIGLIKLILPNAKIIDARRHPMACCFSGFKQLFGEGQDFSYSLEAMGGYYKDYVRLMEHWNRVLPGQILQVQHEELLQDTEGQIRRMLDFCNLPFESGCLEFYRTKRSIKTPSSEQVRQPVNKRAAQQWRHFEPYLQPLKEALGEELLAQYRRYEQL